MSNKNKNILLGVLIVGVLSMTIAFAALSTRLSINGEANVAATSWNVHFQNWSLDTAPTVDGHQNTAVYPSIETLTTSMALSPNITKVDNLNVTLKQPGDYAKYNFEIINEGSIDAKLSNFTASLTPTSDVIGYEVKCYEASTRTGTEVTQNSVLQANGGLAYCYIKIQYNDQTNTSVAGSNQVYSQGEISTSLSANWTWVQDDGNSATPTLTWSQLVGNKTEGFDKFYTPTQTSGGATLPSGEALWIQENTTSGTKEVCGVFSNGTVCLTNASARTSEFTDAENGNVTGYTLQKKTEMEAAGASCSVRSSGVDCGGAGVFCSINKYGGVSCSTFDSSHYCNIGRNGSHYCN